MQHRHFTRSLRGAAAAAAIGAVLVACGGGGDDTATVAAVDGLDAATVVSAAEAGARVPAVPDASTSLLSADEVAGLKFMREEEKLAHDVYVAMDALWNHRTFTQIAQSETSHTEAILALLTKWGVDDPADGNPPGVFEDPELQALYLALVQAGSASLVDGLRAGAVIEETDIRDIEERKLLTDEPDILKVYDSLLCGSRNHLRAFDAALQKEGADYVPEVITQAEWDAIADSPSETCG
jgi:hypothetical protein